MNFRAVALACLMLAVANAVPAASFVVGSDEEMINRASGIVRGSVVDSSTRLAANGLIETVYRFRVAQAMKGEFELDEEILLVELGGRLEDDYLAVSGSPKFNPGTEYVVFLQPRRANEWLTAELLLGQFRVEVAEQGTRILVRDVSESLAWAMDGSSHVERARHESAFVRYIQDVVSGANPVPAYFVDGYIPESDSAAIATEEISPMALDLDLEGASGIAMGQWSSAGSIGYTVSGTPASGDTVANDAENRIIPDDPHGVVDGTFNGSGVLGTAFYGCSGCTFHTVNGEEYASITWADVVINNGVSSATTSQNTLNSTMTHEVGHTLGFRHSNQQKNSSAACALPLPCSDGAIMRSLLVAGLNGVLQAWDSEGANEVYGDGSATSFTGSQYVTDFEFCTVSPPGCAPTIVRPARRMDSSIAWRIFTPVCAASISQHPQSQSVPSGGSANISVTVGTGTYSYQWYRGPKGNVSDPVSGATSSSMNTGALTQTTSFWVRVTRTDCEPDSPLDSNAATVTVIPCTASITQHPQSQSVPEGSAANLSVIVGSGTYSFQWFRGQSGDESELLSGKTSSTLTTDPINSTTSFWVKVTRTDCTPDSVANSNTATVTTCEIPAIVEEPQDASVTSGSGTTLSVTATGTNIFYQWYRGNSGVTSSPVNGGTNPTLATGNLTQTTKYWVRVANNCGGTKTVNSRTVTVTVTAQCTAPQISVQPQPVTIAAGATTTLTVTATGTSLVYQWFEGASGVITKPVGTNSPSYTTAALNATTSFWVRITNGCGQLASQTATVTVTAACTAPAIQQQPQSVTIAPAKTATLSVTATGTSLAYQWYEGVSGNVTRPVGTNNPSFTTPALKKNASYWVRLTNSCGQLASQTATVTVKSSRRHPIRRQ